MNQNDVLQRLREMGVLHTGHFLLTSGRHSGQYMQCAAIFESPGEAGDLVSALVPKLPKSIDTVVAPAIGGILMGYELARHLGCRSLFTERQNGAMMLRRGFRLRPGEKVLIAEDVVTTGGSVREVIEILRSMECSIQGVVALVDRSNGQVDFGVPFYSLLSMEVISYNPEECPLCKSKEPISKPGSR